MFKKFILNIACSLILPAIKAQTGSLPVIFGNFNSCVGDIVKEIANVEYINLTGIRSSEPWNGINIKVTTYDDGSVTTSKIMIKQ